MFSDFFPKIGPLVTSKNVVQPETPQMASQYALHAGQARLHARAHTYTHTYTCISTATIVTRTRLSVTLYVHCVSCLFPAGGFNMVDTLTGEKDIAC
jgi:hypothetical protein